MILDNFEHLLLDVPRVSQLLTATHDIKIIATSRAVLHIYGEREFHVQPLALPPPAETNQTRPLDFAGLAQYGAVQLFLERASAVKPDFQATPGNITSIVEICRRLDGLPLAVSLLLPEPASSRLGPCSSDYLPASNSSKAVLATCL